MLAKLVEDELDRYETPELVAIPEEYLLNQVRSFLQLVYRLNFSPITQTAQIQQVNRLETPRQRRRPAEIVELVVPDELEENDDDEQVSCASTTR
jgi:hypothetical protein